MREAVLLKLSEIQMIRVEYFELALIGTLIALVSILSAIYIIGID